MAFGPLLTVLRASFRIYSKGSILGGGSYAIPGIELGSVAGKTSTLSPVLSLLPTDSFIDATDALSKKVK